METPLTRQVHRDSRVHKPICHHLYTIFDLITATNVIKQRRSSLELKSIQRCWEARVRGDNGEARQATTVLCEDGIERVRMKDGADSAPSQHEVRLVTKPLAGKIKNDNGHEGESN